MTFSYILLTYRLFARTMTWLKYYHLFSCLQKWWKFNTEKLTSTAKYLYFFTISYYQIALKMMLQNFNNSKHSFIFWETFFYHCIIVAINEGHRLYVIKLSNQKFTLLWYFTLIFSSICFINNYQIMLKLYSKLYIYIYYILNYSYEVNWN